MLIGAHNTRPNLGQWCNRTTPRTKCGKKPGLNELKRSDRHEPQNKTNLKKPMSDLRVIDEGTDKCIVPFPKTKISTNRRQTDT